jgi:hypothetical protein
MKWRLTGEIMKERAEDGKEERWAEGLWLGDAAI